MFLVVDGILAIELLTKNIRNYYECEGGIEISIPRISDLHHEGCRVMTNGDHEGLTFLSHPKHK